MPMKKSLERPLSLLFRMSTHPQTRHCRNAITRSLVRVPGGPFVLDEGDGVSRPWRRQCRSDTRGRGNGGHANCRLGTGLATRQALHRCVDHAGTVALGVSLQRMERQSGRFARLSHGCCTAVPSHRSIKSDDVCLAHLGPRLATEIRPSFRARPKSDDARPEQFFCDRSRVGCGTVLQ